MKKNIFTITLTFLLLLGCSGLKVVDPNKPKNQGTLQMDFSGSAPKLVETYTCTMVAANGKRIYATGKNEEEAHQEAILKCQDQTVISFCKTAKVSCEKN